jgi:pyrroline-5-carboxylate reductase
VEVAHSLSDLGAKCNRIFICTGTREVKGVLNDLLHYLPSDRHFITITGGIEFQCLETVFKGRISKTMPTMISSVGAGVTLVMHNSKVLPEDKDFINDIMGKIGLVKEITEDQLDLSADLTSCAPAFFASIFRSLVESGARHGSLTPREVQALVLPTVLGTAKLLAESKIDLNEFIARVATRGGITEEGIKVLDRGLPPVFDELLETTLNKRALVRKQIREQYGISS